MRTQKQLTTAVKAALSPEIRAGYVRVANIFKLLGTSTKVERSNGLGITTKVIYRAPAKTVGRYTDDPQIVGINECGGLSRECWTGCLGGDDGSGRFSAALQRNGQKNSQVVKSLLFHRNRELYYEVARKEVTALAQHCRANGTVPAVRMDGTSDSEFCPLTDAFVRWARDLGVKIYEYTKLKPSDKGRLADSVHYTFSLSERLDSPARAAQWLAIGSNVAIVTTRDAAKALLQRGSVSGMTIVDGDATDVRFLDPAQSIVVLKAKGTLQRSSGARGFVRNEQRALNIIDWLSRSMAVAA